MSYHYFGAIYPTPSPCKEIEPLRVNTSWCSSQTASDNFSSKAMRAQREAATAVAARIVPKMPAARP